MWNNGILHLKSGQLVTGRKALALDTGLSESSVERLLKYLENEHQIEQQKTTKFRVITIVNWNTYQETDSKVDNKRTTNGQQTDTYKKDKKVKNVKNKTIVPQDGTDPVVISEIIDLFKEVNPSYQRLFGMPPQRAAVERLLKVHGKEKLVSMLRFLPKSNASRFAPTITTPVQFEQKLGELIAWGQKQKQPAKKTIVI